jgi:curved DNA-binding protein
VRGSDLSAKIFIDLNEAFSGATSELTLQMPVIDREGHTKTEPKTLRVKIPAGVLSGQQIRLASQGGEGEANAPRGDLYLAVNINPHPFFKLNGHDIYLTLPITPWEAALGAKMTVPTLSGDVEMTVPMGAQSGQVLRLKGRGLKSAHAAGDQYVTFQIVTPPPKTEEQKKLYQTMEKVMSFNPREKLKR